MSTTCPEVFELKGRLSAVKIDEVPFKAKKSCRDASEECPMEAISIEE